MTISCLDISYSPPCPAGDALKCRGQSSYPVNCDLEPACDDSIPIVELTHPPVLHHGAQSLIAEWVGYRVADEIEILVRLTETGTGYHYSIIEHKRVPDVKQKELGTVNIGFTSATHHLDPSMGYFLSFRRVQGGRSSPWVTYAIGEAIHERAFSGGFSIGFQ